MTQAQLADLLNVSARSVQDYEHGITVPWRHFDRLEQITGRPLRWFLHGDEPPHLDESQDLAARRHDELTRRLDELREEQRMITLRLAALERQPRE